MLGRDVWTTLFRVEIDCHAFPGVRRRTGDSGLWGATPLVLKALGVDGIVYAYV